VRWVINTHLHFDHAGGNTVKREGGAVELAFPNATYVVQRGELEFAGSLNERIRASYLPPNFAPVGAAGRWRLVEGEAEVLPGVRVLPSPGHVPFHQSILVSDGGEAACFLGDLVPTSAHLPAPWIMGYDLEPLVTLETKKRLLTRAAREGWTLVFEHDPVVARGRVGRDEKKGWTTELAEKVTAGG
jgi:glyoxylase-like metal-dependent hydrolase (beta-lactamase superfamily II)